MASVLEQHRGVGLGRGRSAVLALGAAALSGVLAYFGTGLRAGTDGVRDPDAVIAAEVPTGTGPTPYARLGDLFAWFCVAAVALLTTTALRRRRTAPVTGPAQQRAESSHTVILQS